MSEQLDFSPEQEFDASYPKLGVLLCIAPPDFYSRYNGTSNVIPSKIIVRGVSPDGPVFAAGLRDNDLIVNVDGISILDLPNAAENLLDAFWKSLKNHSESIRLTILRDSKEETITVNVSRRQTDN